MISQLATGFVWQNDICWDLVLFGFSFSGPATQQPEEVRAENLSTEVFDLAGTSTFPKPAPTGLPQGPVKETLESALIALDSEK